MDKIEEVKRRLDEIKEKIGEEKFNQAIKLMGPALKEAMKIDLGVFDKMLKEDLNEYTEVKSEKKGLIKVEKGLRIRFLDD